MIKTEPPNRRLRIWSYFSFRLYYLRCGRVVRQKMPIQNLCNQQNMAKSIHRLAHSEHFSLLCQWTLLFLICSSLRIKRCISMYRFVLCSEDFFCIFFELTNILRVLCKIILIYDQLTCDRRKRCHNHRIERRKGTIFVYNPCSFACSLVETLVFFTLNILNATYYYCMAKSEWKKNIVNIIINRFLCTF